MLFIQTGLRSTRVVSGVNFTLVTPDLPLPSFPTSLLSTEPSQFRPLACGSPSLLLLLLMVGMSWSKNGLSSVNEAEQGESSAPRCCCCCCTVSFTPPLLLLTSAAVALAVQLVDRRGHVSVADAVALLADVTERRAAGRHDVGFCVWREKNLFNCSHTVIYCRLTTMFFVLLLLLFEAVWLICKQTIFPCNILKDKMFLNATIC